MLSNLCSREFRYSLDFLPIPIPPRTPKIANLFENDAAFPTNRKEISSEIPNFSDISFQSCESLKKKE